MQCSFRQGGRGPKEVVRRLFRHAGAFFANSTSRILVQKTTNNGFKWKPEWDGLGAIEIKTCVGAVGTWESPVCAVLPQRAYGKHNSWASCAY